MSHNIYCNCEDIPLKQFDRFGSKDNDIQIQSRFTNWTRLRVLKLALTTGLRIDKNVFGAS